MAVWEMNSDIENKEGVLIIHRWGLWPLASWDFVPTGMKVGKNTACKARIWLLLIGKNTPPNPNLSIPPIKTLPYETKGAYLKNQ
jgi:hypothetical protein